MEDIQPLFMGFIAGAIGFLMGFIVGPLYFHYDSSWVKGDYIERPVSRDTVKFTEVRAEHYAIDTLFVPKISIDTTYRLRALTWEEEVALGKKMYFEMIIDTCYNKGAWSKHPILDSILKQRGWYCD